MENYSSPRGTDLHDDDPSSSTTAYLRNYSSSASTEVRPDIKPRRPIKARHNCCCCKLTKWLIAALTLTIVTIVVTTLVVVVFVGGQQLAQQQLKDAEVVLQMMISNPNNNTFDVHVTGYMDNRGTAGATLYPTIMTLTFGDQEIGTVPFPQLEIEGGANTYLDLMSTVNIRNTDGLTSFTKALLGANVTMVTLSGKLTVSSLGITFNNVDFVKQVTLQGYNNFAEPPARVLSQEVIEGNSDMLVLRISTELYNQADVAFDNLGTLNLTLMYENVTLGYAISSSETSLNFGRNVLDMIGYMIRTPENGATIDTVLGYYTSGTDFDMTAVGNNQTTSIPILQPALAAFSASITFPSLYHLEDKLLQGGLSYLPTIAAMTKQTDPVVCSFTLLHVYADLYVYAKNPLNVTLVLNEFSSLIDWDGDAASGIESMPFAEARSMNLSVVIPPMSTTVFQQRVCVKISARLTFALDKFVKTKDQSGKEPFFLVVSLTGSVKGVVEAFPIHIQYAQAHIPVTTLAKWIPDTLSPTHVPSLAPTQKPTSTPTFPTSLPSTNPTLAPTHKPTSAPTLPTSLPSTNPTLTPTRTPSNHTASPT